jgi:thiamine kinase-like enzyme
VNPAGWRPLLDGVECLRGRRVEVRELTGGLTNRPLRVTTLDAGRPLDVVVRPPRRGLLGSDRAVEHQASVAAAQAGVAPAVVELVPPDGPLVVTYLDARPLRPAEVRADLARMATLCRTLHAGPPLPTDVDTAAVLRRYAGLVAENGTWLPPGHATLGPTVARALAALAEDPVPRVPCHNDLPGGNVLDDGTRLWLVDFEFAGNNEPWCELGILASGAGLSPEQVEELVAAYDDRAGPGRVARTRLWDAVCSWAWVLWASLQDAVGEVDADFRVLAEELLDRAGAGLSGPGLDRLLDAVYAGARPGALGR